MYGIENKNTGKLLAAVLVLAMVVAGAAVLFSDSEVNAVETDEPQLILTGNCNAYDLSPAGDLGSIVATNAGLGNDITAAYDATTDSYKFTGTLAYQSVAYDAESKTWSGNNTNDSAKVFYSMNWEYANQNKYFGVILNFDKEVNVNNVDDNTPGSSTNTSWIIYLDNSLQTRYVFDAEGTFLYSIDFSALKATANVATLEDYNTASGVNIVDTITVTGDIEVGTAFTVSKTTSVATGSALIVDKNDVITINNGVAFSGTIESAGDNAGSATFTGIKAGGENALTITGGSVIINGEPAAVDQNGRISVTGEAKVTGTVDAGVTLSVEEDANADLTGLTANEGTIEIYGAAEINNLDGKVVVDPAAKITGAFADTAIIVPDADMEKPFYIGGNLEENQSVNNATLNDNLVIPEGLTLTVNGDLFLNGKSITVNGTLIISKNACIYDVGTGEGIILGSEGAIQNSGVIGNGNPVKVAVSASSNVTMQGVSGLEFSVTKVGSTETLAISGDVSRISSIEQNQFTATGVVIGNLTVGKNVTMNVSGDLNVSKNSAVVINGKIEGTTGSIIIDNGSSVSVNGAIANTVTVKVKVGEVGEGSNVTGTDTTNFTFGYVSSGTVDTNVAGITVSAGRITVPNDDGKTSTIYQVAYLNGTLKTIGKAVAAGTAGATQTSEALSITGDFYVAADNTLTITEDVSLSCTGTVTVYGMVVDQTNNADLTYVGAKYTITTTGENSSEDTVTYYTTFEAALGVIDTVDDKTIEAYVEKITTNFTVGADQTVEMNGSSVIVSSDATVTIEADGSLSGITNVEGMVVVKDGGGRRQGRRGLHHPQGRLRSQVRFRRQHRHIRRAQGRHR